MPALVKTEVTANKLTANDTVRLSDPKRGTYSSIRVKFVEVKQKYTWVTFEDGSKDKFEHDIKFIVSRPQMTAAELDDANERSAARWARRMIEEAPVTVAQKKQQLIDDLVYRPDYHDNAYENYVEAQAIAAIWHRVAQYAALDGVGIVNAMRFVREEIIEELTRIRLTSQSTSLMTNAVNAIEVQTWARWVDQLRWNIPTRRYDAI